MGHVAPHRWADAWAGRVSDGERAEMERHADDCRACGRARRRIKGASDSFPQIRALAAPDLPWEKVRAGVHWRISKERRSRDRIEPVRSRFLRPVVLGALGAGALAVALLTGPVSLEPAAPREVVALAPPAPLPAPEAPAPLSALINRATGDVMIDGLLAADPFARTLGPGATIATGRGRVDVQFAEASALALGPGSRAQLRRFDAAAIEVVIEGTVDIELAPRAPGQRFAVIAGARTIEVRGTQFRVTHHREETTISCSRGLVAVREPGGAVEVSAARSLSLPAGRAATSAEVRALSPEELGALADAAPLRLPMWNPETLLHSSAPLEISDAARRHVRVDGVELGAAPLRVRVMPGRHTVETADAAGRFRRAGWVDVVPPAAGAPARFELPAEAPSTRDVSERRRELRTGLDRARLRQCTRQIAKAGLAGTFVQIELRVDERGAVNFLNIIDTDLGAATAGCVRNALSEVRFAPGPAATWRERVEL